MSTISAGTSKTAPVQAGGTSPPELEGRFSVYVDGAARGNPGDAGVGAYLFGPSGEHKAHGSKYIGAKSNNVAEYEALSFGLWLAKQHGVRKLFVLMDSELVVKQVAGEYQTKAPHLKPLKDKVQRQMKWFAACELCHIPREKNREADRLANQAIDKVTGRRRPKRTEEA